MIYLAIPLFALCFALFLMVWRDSSRMTLIATPFLAFAGTEMLAMWTATLAHLPEDDVRGAWALLVVVLAFLAFLAGFVAVGALVGARRDVVGEFRAAPISSMSDADRHRHAIAVVLATFVLLAMGGYLYQGLPPQWVAFVDLLRGADIQDAQGYLSGARFLLTKSASFGGEYRGQGFILAIMNIGWPFVTGVAAVIYRASRRKGWLTATIMLFLLTVTFVGGTGQRGQVVMAILFLLVLFSLLTFARPRHVLMAAVAGMASLMLLTITSGTSGLGTSDANAAGQVSLAAVQRLPKNGISTLQTIEFVDSGDIPRGWGTYQRERLVQSLPGPSGPQLFCHRLHLLLHPTSTATTCASMTQIGQWYADFGLAGSSGGYFLMGAIAAAAQVSLFRLRKGPLELSLIALATMGFMELALGGLVSGAIYFVLLGATYFAFRTAVRWDLQQRRRTPPVRSARAAASSEFVLYLRTIRQRALAVVLAVTIGAVAGWTMSVHATPHYRATATLLVAQVQVPGVTQDRDLAISETIARTLAPLLTARPVAGRAIAQASLPLSADEVVRSLRVTPVPSTQLVRVSAAAPEPALAARVANAVAAAAMDSEQARALLLSPRALSVVEPAAPPTTREWPRVWVSTALGALLTGLAALVLILVRAYVDDTVKDGDTALRVAGLRTIGRIGTVPDRRGRPRGLAVPLSGDEAFRMARTNLAQALDLANTPHQVLMVTSPAIGDGKTSVATNLAVMFGLAGSRVCVVDMDFRQPTLHRVLGCVNREGASTLLLGRGPDSDHVLRTTPYLNVKAITSGPAPEHPADLLDGERLSGVLADLRARFDLVILDASAAIGWSDAILIAARSDAVLLVLRPGRTQSSTLREAATMLRRVGTPVVGVLWNRAHPLRVDRRANLGRSAMRGIGG